jgi:hypothetical protein
LPLSYEHNRQRRCAPMSGNIKPESVATFTEIRINLLKQRFKSISPDLVTLIVRMAEVRQERFLDITSFV